MLKPSAVRGDKPEALDEVLRKHLDLAIERSSFGALVPRLQRLLASLRMLDWAKKKSVRVRITRIKKPGGGFYWEIVPLSKSKRALADMETVREHLPLEDGKRVVAMLASILGRPEYDFEVDLVKTARWLESEMKKRAKKVGHFSPRPIV